MINMYDIIVIGGGLGGLTAGAKMAISGKRVLLIEQHDRVGGCATTFTRKEYTLEVGLHEMDGLHPGDMKSRIFKDLGINDAIDIIKVPEFYRFYNERQDVVVTHDPEEMTQRLCGLFPDEKAGIEDYFYHVMNIRQIMKKKELDPDMTIGQFLDSVISNEDLKLILLGNLGYFHDDPYGLSLGYYCMAQNSYYTGGGNFIKGGSQKLSDSLARVITDQGGQVWLNHRVVGITVESDRVTGVTYESDQQDGVQFVGADVVISNASIPQVSHELLYGDYRGFTSAFSGLVPGASLLTVYFGFKEELSQLGWKNYATFVFDPSVQAQSDILKNNQGSYRQRSFTFVDYGQIDSGLAPEGRSVGAICCIDYTSDWEDLSRDEYRAKKREVKEIFQDRLEQLIPGVKDCIDHCEVATALTVQRYTLNPNGAVYGYAQTPERVRTQVQSPLENLHFASAWTQTGGGFSGAIFSGYLCAMDVIRKGRG